MSHRKKMLLEFMAIKISSHFFLKVCLRKVVNVVIKTIKATQESFHLLKKSFKAVLITNQLGYNGKLTLMIN